MEYLLGQLLELKEQGSTLYVYLLPTTLSGYAIHPGSNAGIAKANAMWGPILDKMQSLPGMTPFQTRPLGFTNYREFFDTTGTTRRHSKHEGTPVPSEQSQDISKWDLGEKCCRETNDK